MLILPSMLYTRDNELDDFIDTFITEAIKGKLGDVIHSYESGHDVNDVFYDKDMLKYYFPENFPVDNKEKMLETMKALYSLIMAKDRWIPTLLMEYVLDKVIEYGIEDYEEERDYVIKDLLDRGIIKSSEPEVNVFRNDCFKDDIFRNHYFDHLDHLNTQFLENIKKSQDKEVDIPFTDNTFDRLVRAYKSNCEEEGIWSEDTTEEYKETYCKDIVNNIWHFSREWLEWCFWDWDFLCLDDMEMGELRHSFVNEYADILPENSEDERYFLPDDWEHSKDFGFLNEERKNDIW